MCKQRWSQTAVGICFLFYCLICRTEGNNELQKRLDVLENRYDVGSDQYKSGMQELWSPNAIPIDEQVQQHSGEFTTDTIIGITEQTHRTINGFQTGLTAEKSYIRKEIELFKHTTKEEHIELVIHLDEFERKMEDEFKKIESKIETVAVNLRDVLANAKNVCRTTIQDMGIEQMLETGMKEIRDKAYNATADLKSIVFNNEHKTNMKLIEVENEVSDKLRKIEENLERKQVVVEKNTSCSGSDRRIRWVRHGSFCYYFSRDDKRTWFSARDRCEELGGYLAEPIEDSDAMFLYVMFGHKNFWMGGIDFYGDDWYWNHQWTSISTQNGFWGHRYRWRYRNCLEWTAYERAWNGAECTDSQHYICQK